MKIKGFRGIRCQYGLNQRESFPVYFASVLFLGEMGRGYARLPFEDNRGCPWTGEGQWLLRPFIWKNLNIFAVGP